MTRRLPRPAAPGRAPSRLRARPGFTLVELTAAVILLTIGLLAIAGLGVVAAKTTRRGSVQTLASAVAQSRFDSLASLPCGTLANGSPTTGASTVRDVKERWRVVDGYNVKRLTDSITVPGRANVLVYQSVIPCRE